MAYQVCLAESAAADAERIYAWVTERAPLRGRRWFEKLIEALRSLDLHPSRCPLAREARESKRDIRCLLFGKRRGVYRILYEVDEKRKIVWILHIRHSALRDLEPNELERLPEEG
jgi:plasmid stabilization system protein ParE